MGNKVKELREAQKMTQEELARKTGLVRQTIAKVENSADATVTTETMKKIADGLGVSLAFIFS